MHWCPSGPRLRGFLWAGFVIMFGGGGRRVAGSDGSLQAATLGGDVGLGQPLGGSGAGLGRC